MEATSNKIIPDEHSAPAAGLQNLKRYQSVLNCRTIDYSNYWTKDFVEPKVFSDRSSQNYIKNPFPSFAAKSFTRKYPDVDILQFCVGAMILHFFQKSTILPIT